MLEVTELTVIKQGAFQMRGGECQLAGDSKAGRGYDLQASDVFQLGLGVAGS